MAYFESVQQGDKGSLATEFFPSVCQGDQGSVSDKFFESVMTVGGGETYLQKFRVDSSATSFEIKR